MLVTGLYLMVPDITPLYFSAEDIAQGRSWRIVTGHLMHADAAHLFWNCLGLAVLGALIERYSRTGLWAFSWRRYRGGQRPVDVAVVATGVLLRPVRCAQHLAAGCTLAGMVTHPLLAGRCDRLRQHRQSCHRGDHGPVSPDKYQLATLCMVTRGRPCGRCTADRVSQYQ